MQDCPIRHGVAVDIAREDGLVGAGADEYERFVLGVEQFAVDARGDVDLVAGLGGVDGEGGSRPTQIAVAR